MSVEFQDRAISFLYSYRSLLESLLKDNEDLISKEDKNGIIRDVQQLDQAIAHKKDLQKGGIDEV